MNTLLHLLTNRKEGFSQPGVYPDKDLTLPEETPELMSLRKALRLNITSTDYYWVHYLLNLYSFPHLRKILGTDFDSITTSLKFPPVEIWNGKLIADKTLPPKFFIHATEFPAPTKMRVQKITEDAVKITLSGRHASDGELYDSRESYHVRARQLADGNIKVDWPQELDIRGLLTPENWWVSNTLDIDFWPVSFPWSALVSSLTSNNNVGLVLHKADLIPAFHRADSPESKIATLTAAIILVCLKTL